MPPLTVQGDRAERCAIVVSSLVIGDDLTADVEVTDEECDAGASGSVSVPLINEAHGIALESGAGLGVLDGFEQPLFEWFNEAGDLLFKVAEPVRPAADQDEAAFQVLEPLEGQCGPRFDGSSFSGVLFRTDDGDRTVAAGEDAIIRVDGIAFVAAVPWALLRPANPDRDFEGFYYLWRSDPL